MYVNLVVDVQNGFVKDGPLKVPGADKVAEDIIKYVKECRMRGEAIFATCDTHFKETYAETIEGKTLPMHCEAGSEEHKLVEGLVKDENRRVNIPQGHIIDKSTFSDCRVAGLIDSTMCDLREPIDAIKVFGFVTSICVLNNALTLRNHFPKAKIWIVAPLCRDLNHESEEAAFLVAKNCLIDIVNPDGSPA